MSTAKAVGMILLLNSINGLLFGMGFKYAISWLFIGTVIVYIFLCAFLYDVMIKSEAKKRTPTNPITSYDQRGSTFSAIVILFILGLPFIWIGMNFF